MSILPSLVDHVSHLGTAVAEYTQPTIHEEETLPSAIRAFIIIGAFVVVPVSIAWFMSRCAEIYEARHPEES